MPLAHPITGSSSLPVPPLVLAAVTVVLAALVATRVAAAKAPVARPVREPRGLWVTRLVALLLLLFLVAVARGGPDEEPRNLASVTVPYVLWPGLILLSLACGPLPWRALDPWRALGAVERLFGAPPPPRAPAPAATPAEAAAPDAPSPPAGAADAPDPGAPSTAAPSTAAPSTAAPSTAAPSTAAPSTAAPSVAAPPAGPAVWPAVVIGGGWALFLALHAVTIPPRTLAAALAAYAVVVLAGCVAVGRDRWLPAADGAGLVIGWAGLLRRGRLVTWAPPPGAAALLGAVFGGAAFTRLRLSGTWGDLVPPQNGLAWHRAGAVAAVAGGAALAYAAERWAARRGAAGSVAAALVPVVAATVVALTLRRLMVAAQLAALLANDPFRAGWRLLGPLAGPRPVDVNPWGTPVQQGLSAGLVALGAVAGAYVLARRVRGVRARDPAAYVVYVTAFLGALLAVSR